MVSPASAAPAVAICAAPLRRHSSPPGPYAAAADASLLTLDIPSLSPALLPQTNVDLARSQANAESDADVDADKAGAQRTGAIAGTTGSTSLLGAPIELQVNEASAPESEANEDILIPLDLSPLLDLPVIRTTALANWVSDTECVAADTPLSLADQSLADLTLLGIAEGQSVVELDTDDADGAADTEASTYLASIPGDNDPRAVQARVTTNVTERQRAQRHRPRPRHGHPGRRRPDAELRRERHAASPAARRSPVRIPVVDVTIGGDTDHHPRLRQPEHQDGHDHRPGARRPPRPRPTRASAPTSSTTSAWARSSRSWSPIEDAVADGAHRAAADRPPVDPGHQEGRQPERHQRQRPGLAPPGRAPPADRRSAPPSRSPTSLNQILGALGADLDGPLLQLDLGPVGASVVAPAGGITCGEPTNPLRETNKHASATEVAPGGTFEYNIAVPNRGPCVVRDVTVTDVVTGPAGFEIIGTEPDGTVNGGNISWDLGDIEVNETVNLTVTVRVPDNAPND